MNDLFGNPENYRHEGTGKKGRNADPKGYAARPGSGPQGETCSTCAHYRRVNHNGLIFRKCGVIEWRWTHGAGTDIKAGSAACSYWEEA